MLSESAISVAENGANATYTIVLDAEPQTPLTVNLANSASSEISISPTVLDFTSVNWDLEQTVTVLAVDDDRVESLAEVTITHSVVISDTDYEWTGEFSPSEDLTVRVYDNDEAGILISTSALYINEAGIGTYTVELMGSPSSNVQVGSREEYPQ